MKNFTRSLKRTILYLLYYIYLRKYTTTINPVSYILFRTSCIGFQYIHHSYWTFVIPFSICQPLILTLCHTIFSMSTTDTDVVSHSVLYVHHWYWRCVTQYSICPPLILTLCHTVFNMSTTHTDFVSHNVQYVHHWWWPCVTQWSIWPPLTLTLCHTVFNMSTTHTDLVSVFSLSTTDTIYSYQNEL